MFDHVTIRAPDREASERFYDTVLAPLGVEKRHSGEHYAEWGDFSLAQASGDRPATQRLHVAFVAPSRAHVDEFWNVGRAAGYRDDGAPGPRPQYNTSYYGAFLLDPGGNSAEAVHHSEPRSGTIDHLWLRVADLEEAKRFYVLVAPYTGFGLESEGSNRRTFAGEGGSFSVVTGAPTEHVHMAFPASSNGHRRRVPPSGDRGRLPGQRSSGESGRCTTRATTAHSCSTPIVSSQD